MTKKFSKRVEEPRSPKPPVAPEDTAYLVREDLEEPQERFKQGAAAWRTPAPTAPAEPPAAPATVIAKPLAPLGALWPSSVPSQGEATPSQEPAPAPAPPSPKPPAQAAPPTPLTAVIAPAPKPTVTKTVKVTFTLLEPDAKQVALTGDFNGWATGTTPMQRQADGHWETTVALAPGRYQYKFIVDGHWIPDPLVPEHVWNQHGTLNSVIEVRA
jgi:hypothetical protein